MHHISDDDEEEQKKSVNYIPCNFNVKGTTFITRQSKYKMEFAYPHESSRNQVEMGSLSIIQHPETYEIYQNMDLNHDFTK